MNHDSNIFLELLAKYATHAWPFMLGHVLVLVFVARSWWGMHRETQELERWQPDRGFVNGSERPRSASAILDQFVREAEHLGRKGLVVPMTDFSDRLDSTVNGRVAEVNEKINLFLIVGIAGSLFGVFEFALRASTLLAGDDPSGQRIVGLGMVLSASLAKAFPVGFIGLVLMFLFQIVASVREAALRAAVTRATQLAVQQRSKVVQSQAQIIEQASTTIKAALEPLQNLEELLAGSLQPVVAELGARLDQSLRLIEAQFKQLHGTTAGFSDSVGLLKSVTESLHENTKDLATLLRETPEVLKRIDETQGRQFGILDRFEANLTKGMGALDRLLPAVETATAGVRDLPASMQDATRASLSLAGREASKAWIDAASRVEQRVTSDCRNMFGDLATQAQTLAGHVAGAQTVFNVAAQQQSEHLRDLASQASDELRGVASAVQTTLRAFEAMRTEAQETLAAEFRALRTDAAGTWNEMVGKFGGPLQREMLIYVDKLSDAAQALKKSLEGVIDQVQRAFDNNQAHREDQIRSTMMAVHEDVSESLKVLDRLFATHIPQATEKTTAFTAGVAALLEDVGKSRNDLEQWVKALDQARQAFDAIVERMRTESPACRDDSAYRADLLAKLQQILDAMAAGLRAPGPQPRERPGDGGRNDEGWWANVKHTFTRSRRSS